MLLKCIDNSRIDVLCSILAQLSKILILKFPYSLIKFILSEQKPNFQETLDVICCAEGTLLHRAVQLGKFIVFTFRQIALNSIIFGDELISDR